LNVLSCACSAARLRRTSKFIADGDDSLALLVARSGAMMATQLGNEVSPGIGDGFFALNGEPFELNHASINAAVLIVPRAALAPLVPNVEDAGLRHIPRDNEALRLLVGYLHGLPQDVGIATPELRHLVVTHVHDLMAMAIGASRDAAAVAADRGVRAARLAAIKADVLAHLALGNLGLAMLARRHQLTPRSIQLLFEAEGTTFSAFLLEQRLVRAYRMLTDPRHAGATISAVAFAAGFGDLSHFNRNFRRRFGATPSDVRAAGRVDAGASAGTPERQ
jgi:AraC-like DNA-binding protein